MRRSRITVGRGHTLGRILGTGRNTAKLGATPKTISEPLSATSLAGVDCLIIVDPDIPAEAANPQYISDAEAAAVERWVNLGGALVLFGNDPGNVVLNI